MKYGFVLSWGSPAEILDLAREAEASGWDGVFTWDAISLGTTPVYDAWVMMGAIAGVTERVRIGAMVLPLSRRRPWKVAKEAITIDHLSNGRLVLPVALGVADDAGFHAVNTDSTDRRERAQRLDECLDILALAQTGEPFFYHGEQYQIEMMQIRPRPVQERIPVWAVGGWPKPKSLQRALRWDGIIPSNMTPGADPFQPMPAEIVAEVAEWVAAHRQQDSPFDIAIEGKSADAFDTDYVGAIHEAGATWFIENRWDEAETPATLLDRIRKGPPRLV